MTQRQSADLQALLLRCADRDQQAFATLYERTSAKLFGIVIGILGRGTHAEDALQEIYLKVWQRSGSYRPQYGAPMTWLISVARNHALDVIRKNATENRLRDDRDTDALLQTLTGQASEGHADHLQAGILQQCLMQLESRARECILRAYCEGYSHQELSIRFDKPLGTVKSWIRRALASLRSCVDEHC